MKPHIRRVQRNGIYYWAIYAHRWLSLSPIMYASHINILREYWKIFQAK